MKRKLATVLPRVERVHSRLQRASTPSEQRMAGRALQSRRLRVWQANPHCVHCKRFTSYPNGFHLDHVVALCNGGADTEQNTQVLCIACHEAKTASDLAADQGVGQKFRN